MGYRFFFQNITIMKITTYNVLEKSLKVRYKLEKNITINIRKKIWWSYIMVIYVIILTDLLGFFLVKEILKI